MLVQIYIAIMVIGFAFLAAGLIHPQPIKRAIFLAYSFLMFLFTGHYSFNIEMVEGGATHAFTYSTFGYSFSVLMLINVALMIGYTLWGGAKELE